MLLYLFIGVIIFIGILIAFFLYSFLQLNIKKISMVVLCFLVAIEIGSFLVIYFVFVHDVKTSQKINIEQLKKIDFTEFFH